MREAVNQGKHALLAASCFSSMVWLAVYGLHWVPLPRSTSSPPDKFAEDRALEHATHLSENIGNRIVGTRNAEVAAQYVLAQAHRIAALADLHPHLTAQVDREQATGGFNAHFAGVDIASVYHNLTNVMLYLSPIYPPGVSAPPALLLNSHFDSVFGTTGASDCASCVGVMLEVARALLANPDTRLASPVLFLFNGGEESLLLAAHGFMTTSKWWPQLGAFINLESTGPGGPAYLFQHTGGWSSRAYARAAKYPFGSAVGQDFFDSRLLAMDTDFRIFSAQHHGSLPGIDLAYIMDGAAYHTKQDKVARIRKGTVQASGDNILAAVKSFTDVLAQPEMASTGENAVFFDVLGWFMITYPWWLGKLLHTLPLALILGATLLGRVPGRVSAKQQGVSMSTVLTSAARTAASLMTAVLFGCLLGLLRTFVTGQSLVWFGKPDLLFALYGPAVTAGLLLPHAIFQRQQPGLQSSILGHGLLSSLIAALLTQLTARSGFMFAAWGFCSFLAAGITEEQERPSLAKMLAVYVCSIPAVLLTAPLITTLTVFIMEHISISGSPPPPYGYLVGDVALGAVCGLSVFTAGAFYAACVAQTAQKYLKRTIASLLGVSVIVAAFASAFSDPYSVRHPKRVLLQHLHEMDGQGHIFASSWSVAGLDPIPVSAALPPGTVSLPSKPEEWQALYPLSRLMRGISISAPPPDPALLKAGHSAFSIRLLRKERQDGDVQRWHLELSAAKPPWGTLNVTGDLRAWSFADSLQKSKTQAAGHMLRFAGNEENWQFWLDVASKKIGINAAVIFMDDSPTIDSFASTFPAWIVNSNLERNKKAFYLM